MREKKNIDEKMRGDVNIVGERVIDCTTEGLEKVAVGVERTHSLTH